MATLLLSAAGAALGGSLGGSVLGLTGAVLGRAVGATAGRLIDQKLLGAGSSAVSSGRLDRYRVTGASEGTAIPVIFGRTRVGGQVIWSTAFKEHRETQSAGGKGGGGGRITTYSYSVSCAVAVCEGVIKRIGRVWADGVELSRESVTMRVYNGAEDQLPDALVEAIEGADNAPAYRGVAYVVFEDLPLAEFGNRVPQFSFEVFRACSSTVVPEDARSLSSLIKGVCLLPGSGEYALATTKVTKDRGLGRRTPINVHGASTATDFANALEGLAEELPACRSVSLIVSWFGDDLRVGSCTLRPKVEQTEGEGAEMPWVVNGIARADADAVAQVEGRSVYGGTPADASVIEAIQAVRHAGMDVVFYPFILMEQLAGNTLPDPWTTGTEQPQLPWRGRITTSIAPGITGSPDRTEQAHAEVDAFFGTAVPADFQVTEGGIVYTGPTEWSYRRFILHYAMLCQMAGGVESFCIGSEMRGLTRIRGASTPYPAAAHLQTLAADVRSILGPETKIGYCADWSEYAGYVPPGEPDTLLFPLDSLWGDNNIDFVGIDNYMPLSDWRDDAGHTDQHWRSIYQLDYLRSNIEGGEGYDWYYASASDRAAQNRTPITDGAFGEHWVFRYKDLRGWWTNEHRERVKGVRDSQPTPWQPQSKPIWFTEYGCAALDKGTNQPNKFLDAKSSESALAYHSNGQRDDLIQAQYLRAHTLYWADNQVNPTSPIYGGPMVDMEHAHAWAWDARPFPYFPGLQDVWSDGENYLRGHWLSGRVCAESLAAVIAELCNRAGISDVDVSQVYGLVRGFAIDSHETARGSLQSLLLAHGVDTFERDGKLIFRMRRHPTLFALPQGDFADVDDVDGRVETTLGSFTEKSARLRLNYVRSDGDFEVGAVEASTPDREAVASNQTDLAMTLSSGEAQAIADRWLAESSVAQASARFALPPSYADIGVGDVVDLPGSGLFRVDHIEVGTARLMEVVRVEPSIYEPGEIVEEILPPKRVGIGSVPQGVFLDLPLITGDELPHAPHIAVAASPWPGDVAVYAAAQDAGYSLQTLVKQGAMPGLTQGPLAKAAEGLWDRGPALRVSFGAGSLSSAEIGAVLAGANAAAIGDASGDEDWEVFQFASAELVAEDTYDLSMRLRGQLGTDAVMKDEWPAGSLVVLLDSSITQLTLAANKRGIEQHYRVGPAAQPYNSTDYTHLVRSFSGVGLRPYAPAHLTATSVGSDVTVSWIRRTRIDGDHWDGGDVPLGEARELYRVRVRHAGSFVRTSDVPTPGWIYTAAEQAADGVSGTITIDVAQISDRYGAGPATRIEINV